MAQTGCLASVSLPQGSCGYNSSLPPSNDSVYMENEEKIQEYVLNERGVIFKGSGNYISPMFWDYGQFEDDMVEIALTLLYVSPEHLTNPMKDEAARYNPIYVSRIISRMINSDEDRGVLKGQWEGPYIGGMSPTHWSGSYPILKRWYNIGCHPVKFGQCWVFAGVMCSVMRALGIPCRVITNYESAHDCDKNLTIDVYHADWGVKEIPSPDSIWTFHVWCEGWMKRPDLSPEFDGWQVLDPTPQELSGGVHRCGPAPVKAILNGNTDLDYDVPFVFAEVNADCNDYLVWIMCNGSKKTISTDSRRVGQNISTKSVGSNKRWDITSHYKHTEGQAHRIKYVSSPVVSAAVTLLLLGFSCLSRADLRVPVVVPFDKYWPKMLDKDVMNVTAIVKDTGDTMERYLAEVDVVLEDPPFNVKVRGGNQVSTLFGGLIGGAVVLKIYIKVHVFCVSKTPDTCVRVLSLPDIGPKRRFRVTVSFYPRKAGKKTLMADFDCSVFKNIKKSIPITVQKYNLF
uniref:protein-glutamine gamma-glutamyltransferase n=1 Tax=Neogobius melanostomus TaxID=47308 RepID=A0A8C6WHZ5_9GOBI